MFKTEDGSLKTITACRNNYIYKLKFYHKSLYNAYTEEFEYDVNV